MLYIANDNYPTNMLQPILKTTVYLCFPLFITYNGIAQCSGGTDGGALSPAPTSTFQTMSVSDGTYYTFVVPSLDDGCYDYTFTFCSDGGSAAFDTQLTILDNTGAYAGGYNDDNCSLQSEIAGWSPPAAGTYRILVNTYDCASSGNTGTLAYIENSSIEGDYSLAGDAVFSEPDCVILTADATGQTGCVWDATSTLDFDSDFTYDFTVNLGDDDGGADGMAFVIQNDPAGRCACGTSGGGFGTSGIDNSLIIEIDTYLNTEDRDDGAGMDDMGVLCAGGPDPDHLDIWEDGNVNPAGIACPGSPGARIIPTAEPLTDGGVEYNVENGLDHILRVTWTAATTTLDAALLDETATTTYGSVSHSFDPMTLFGTTTPFFGITAATGGLSNEQIFCNSPILLSVKYKSFGVNCGVSGNLVEWEAASQMNNAFFTVLRSIDGENFVPIAQIPGAGNSNIAMSYSYIDSDAPIGTLYYTVSQTDWDGREELSGLVKTVSCQNKSLISIYPNPVNCNAPITVEFDEVTIPVTISIIDTRGGVVYTETFNDQGPKEILDLKLSAGIYKVFITDSMGKNYPAELLVITN